MKIICLILILLSVSFCSKEKVYRTNFSEMDTIRADKYFASDVLTDYRKNIYGDWRVTGTSGGFTGKGYRKDFDYLVLKPNGIFGIIRNDSLIAFGKMVISQDNYGLLCRFSPEKPAQIELLSDPEKYLFLVSMDSLNLYTPCCDRFNTHLIRVK